MKAQILDKLVDGREGLGQVIRLVSARIVAVVAFGLVLTLIFWLFWLENYAWGAFLLGAFFGLSAFLTLNSLKKRLNLGRSGQGSASEGKTEDLAGPGSVRSESPVAE